MTRKIATLLCFVIVFAAVFCFSSCKKADESGATEFASQNGNAIIGNNVIVNNPQSEDDCVSLKSDQGIVVRGVCRMENPSGAGEDVAGIEVYNESSKTLRYAEIVATFQGDVTHIYKVTTLPPGATCFVEEENGASYRETDEGFFGFEIKNAAYFTEEPSLYSDKLQFSGADGILTVKNISGSDIAEKIIVYYKDYKNAQLSSGKTYRVTIEGGLKATEMKQTVASHYKQGESILMFVQLVPSEVE